MNIKSAILAAITTLSVTGAHAQEILVGQSISLKNNGSEYAREVLKGIETHFKASNNSGGISGKKLKLMSLDDNGSPATAESNAKQLIDGGASILFAPSSPSTSDAMLKAATEKGRDIIVFGSRSASQDNRSIPVLAGQQTQMRALLKEASSAGWERFAFIRENSPSGRSNLDEIQSYAKTIGAQMIAEITLEPSSSPQKAQAFIASAKSNGIESVLVQNAALLQHIVPQARSSMYHGVFMTPGDGAADVAKSMGTAGKGIVLGQPFPSISSGRYEIVREFMANWKAHHETPPTTGALEGYINAKALTSVLKRTGGKTDAALIRSALYASPIIMGEITLKYAPGAHLGSTFVETTVIDASGKIRHN